MALLSAVIGYGLLAARPAAGTAGRLYYATDGPALYRDNGSTWDSLTLGGMTNPMTTQDDLIVGGSSGTPARLAKGTDGQVLTVDPTTHHLLWATPAAGGSALTVEEVDGSPTDSAVTKIKFPNGSLGIAAHVATYTPPLEKLAQTTVTGSVAASISFPSIPQTHTDLWLVFSGRGDVAAVATNLKFRLNNDSGNNYNDQQIYAAATTVTGAEDISAAQAHAGVLAGASAASGVASMLDLLIPNYVGGTFHKAYRSVSADNRGVASGAHLALTTTGLYRSTTAITRLDIFPSSGNFAIGTVATLYGIG
jgi:hypothetical protein